MPKNRSSLFVAAALFTASLLVAVTPAAAQTPTVIHDFSNTGTDGYTTYAGLIVDASGNLYATTLDGGTHNGCYGENIGCGTVFELSPAAGGGWTETILHDFSLDGRDGYSPNGSLIFDSEGNLYGTTLYGGKYGDGTVFELSPKAGGGWTENTLHAFSGPDGSNPPAALIFDASGNLYGTTANGGAHNLGAVFELTHSANGGWPEKLLHSFQGRDGSAPYSSLVFDSAGNLYGTTLQGGAYNNAGTAFELTPGPGGGWSEKVIFNFAFNEKNGASPHAGLIIDAAGNLYGTTEVGGSAHWGTVFELSPSVGTQWTETVLHNFANNGTDGFEPLGSLIFDDSGNLYGTTFQGGTGSCGEQTCGTVFKLSPATGGAFAETIYSFANYTDGYWPASNLVFDSLGNLFGTTLNGGTDGGCVCGTVFELTP